MVAISTYGTLINLFGNRILGRYNNCARTSFVTIPQEFAITISQCIGP
jgi:hypothetical protein